MTSTTNFCPSCGGKLPGEHNLCDSCRFNRASSKLRLPGRDLTPLRWVTAMFFLLGMIAVIGGGIWTISNIPYDVGDIVLVGLFFLALELAALGLFTLAWYQIDKAENARR